MIFDFVSDKEEDFTKGLVFPKWNFIHMLLFILVWLKYLQKIFDTTVLDAYSEDDIHGIGDALERCKLVLRL